MQHDLMNLFSVPVYKVSLSREFSTSELDYINALSNPTV